MLSYLIEMSGDTLFALEFTPILLGLGHAFQLCKQGGTFHSEGIADPDGGKIAHQLAGAPLADAKEFFDGVTVEKGSGKLVQLLNNFVKAMKPNGLGGHGESLRSQIATLKRGQHRKYAPYVFTEQGIAMLSSVLSSERAILVNIAIIRTFVRLRQILATHAELARQLDELRWRQEEQGQQIQAVFETIQHLIEAPAEDPKKRFGFPIPEAGAPVRE
jgi:hypothetical protein